MSLGKKTSTAVIWSFGEQLARRGVGIMVTLLLARFLVPEDFGLMAMMTVFLSLGQSLMDSGFRQALIRLPEITETDYATAFFANLTLGVISYGVLFAAAPAIAAFYEESRLVDLVRVASLVIIVNSFQVIQIATLSRELNFKAQMQASLPASIISGVVAVGLAYLSFGVWALVIQSLLGAVIHTAILWRRHGWRPKAACTWASAKGMYNFGYKLFLSESLETLFKNIYPLVIAKLFNASVAGLYFFADRIRELVVTQLLHSIQAVTFPALAKKQSNKLELKSAYRRVIRVIIALYVPMVAGLILIAPWLFELLFPEDWYSAHRYLQIMSLAALLYPIHSLNLNILRVLGRSDILLTLQVFKKVVTTIVLVITAQIGIEAVLWGQVVQSLIFYFPNKYYSDRLIDYSFIEQLKDIGLFYGASALIFTFSVWVVAQVEVDALVSLALACSVFSTLYIFVILMLDKPLIGEVLKVVRKA
ncbi:lipopolysaccharide biosynthesis protein [Marinobacter sp. F4206]|uniref:lipopolysaccharide biosynthesis protein n=1 Tax=Marinobacter sp. F4206 TaxID=2861777 RepID=UPI001C5F57C7|nr:lipopolysaccharide biosynthesis protein [Marinobacter sp. F4206]MBW4933797.1 lipopolysaccharide biosynthesis protein [Marinobacter sp. F4206]